MAQPGRSDIPSFQAPDLLELAMPSKVSLWPQTYAWWIAAALIIFIIGAVIYWRYRVYCRQLWCRQAKALAATAKQSGEISDWFELLKRVSLVHHSREYVASMSDKQLLDPLSLSPSLQNTLIEQHYQQGRLTTEQNAQMYDAVSLWLQKLKRSKGLKKLDQNKGLKGQAHA